MLAHLGGETLSIAFKSFFLAIGEVRIVSPERVASQDEATVLALPLKARLARLRRVLPVSETKIASLLALNGASFLTTRLRSLALIALVLAPRLRTFLALNAISGVMLNQQRFWHTEVLWP